MFLSGETPLNAAGRTDDMEELAGAVAEQVRGLAVNGEDPLLDIDDVADYLGVCRRTVETIITKGKLKPIRVRSQRRFTRDARQAYLQNSVGKDD